LESGSYAAAGRQHDCRFPNPFNHLQDVRGHTFERGCACGSKVPLIESVFRFFAPQSEKTKYKEE